MVYTVTFNPAIDYIAHVEKFRLGETNRTCGEFMRPGGKGINVSVMLRRFGVPTRALGFIGGFTGAALEEMCGAEGVDTDFIRCGGNTRINVKLKAAKETEINGKGVAVSENELGMLKDKLRGLKSGDWLVLAGSVPFGMPENLYADILGSVERKGINAVVDATGGLLLNTLKCKPLLIKPNVRELEELFGVEISSRSQIAEYAKKLVSLGAQNVIVSMGGDGAIFTNRSGECMYLPAPHGKLVDSVGAGDSLVAGFIAGFILSSSEKDGFITGVAAGSATAFSEWLASKDYVFELKSRMKTVALPADIL